MDKKTNKAIKSDLVSLNLTYRQLQIDGLESCPKKFYFQDGLPQL